MSHFNLISEILKVPKKPDDITNFVGFVIDPFEFSILLNDDGSIWKGTGSIEYHKHREKNEHWDNDHWMNGVLDGDKESIDQIPKELTKEERKTLIRVIEIARNKGWL